MGAPSRTGGSRSAGRSQAGGLSDADGADKQFVLPDDDAPAGDVAAPTTSTGQSQTRQTKRPASHPRPEDQPRSRDPLDAGRDGLAVNPLAAASQPEPAPAPLVTQGTGNPAITVAMAVSAQQQAGRGANGVTAIAAWWQSAQGANQQATGQSQASMNRPAGTITADWLQGQAEAPAAAGQPQQPAAATASVADTTAMQVSGKDIGPRTSQTANLAGATAAVGAANGNKVVPSGIEAKPTSPNALPAAATGETAQAAPASQAGAHRAGAQSLSSMAHEGVVSAAGEKSSIEVDPNLQAQAKLIDRPEQTARSRSASMLDAARSAEADATSQTSVLAGSQHADSAAQAAPHVIHAFGEQRIAGASRPAEQIIESVRQAVANGQREVTINLSPPELGRVRLTMYSEGNEIHGRIEVDNPRTLTEIRHQAELLTQRLAEDGIAIRRLDVHQMTNSGGQTGSYSPQQQDAAGQTPWSHARQMPAEQQRDRELAGQASTAQARAAASAGAGEPLSAGGLNVWM